MAKKHDIIEVSGNVLHETDGAFLFTNGDMLKMADGSDSKSPKASWIPKSQCQWDASDNTMQMPQWLAIEKGLI